MLFLYFNKWEASLCIEQLLLQKNVKNILLFFQIHIYSTGNNKTDEDSNILKTQVKNITLQNTMTFYILKPNLYLKIMSVYFLLDQYEYTLE